MRGENTKGLSDFHTKSGCQGRQTGLGKARKWGPVKVPRFLTQEGFFGGLGGKEKSSHMIGTKTKKDKPRKKKNKKKKQNTTPANGNVYKQHLLVKEEIASVSRR